MWMVLHAQTHIHFSNGEIFVTASSNAKMGLMNFIVISENSINLKTMNFNVVMACVSQLNLHLMQCPIVWSRVMNKNKKRRR